MMVSVCGEGSGLGPLEC